MIDMSLAHADTTRYLITNNTGNACNLYFLLFYRTTIPCHKLPSNTAADVNGDEAAAVIRLKRNANFESLFLFSILFILSFLLPLSNPSSSSVLMFSFSHSHSQPDSLSFTLLHSLLMFQLLTYPAGIPSPGRVLYDKQTSKLETSRLSFKNINKWGTK